jgi:uncharacterized membrane protein (DUF2068 family)
MIPSTSQKMLRLIAIFEGVKGFAAIASAFGILSLVHHDIRHLASQMIGYFNWDRDHHYPHLLLNLADQIAGTPTSSILLIAFAYAAVRLTEATGIWFGLAWGEWLAAFSGSIYMPLELIHLYKAPSLISLAVFLFNLLIVIFMVIQLLKRRQASISTF